MSPLFLGAMVALDLGATVSFLYEGKYALAVIFLCAAIANAATYWVI